MKPVVCVDIDGVLAKYDGGWVGLDTFGDPIPGAVEFTKRLSVWADVVVHTCRCTKDLHRMAPEFLERYVREWLDRHGFVYSAVWTGEGKPIAHAYVDDRAVAVPVNPQPRDYERMEAQAAALSELKHGKE